jgi:DNA repair exonuclease SbcCD ATPase subunit
VPGKPASRLRTVEDEAEPETEQTKKLSSLASRVKQISSHLEEEIKARAKQRQLLEEMHEEELRKVEAVGAELDEQMAELAQFVSDFKRRYTEQLHGVYDDLQGQLDRTIQPVFPRLLALEARARRVRDGIDKEREERVRESERVLAPLREQLKQLGTELETEREICKANADEIDRKMHEAADALHSACEAEEAAREHKHAGMAQEIAYDKARLATKQREVVEKSSVQLVADLSRELEQEQDERVGHQDPIIKMLTNFVEQFQADVKERAGS